MSDSNSPVGGWARSLLAAEWVKERLQRAARALEDAKVPYSVVGGNAVAEWVRRVDEGAVRDTRDIEILIRSHELTAATTALESAEFRHRESDEFEWFQDLRADRSSHAVWILFGGELAKPDEIHRLPRVEESENAPDFRVATLEAVVRFELIKWRTKHRMHVRDLIDVGLIDKSWPPRFPSPLGDRLQELLDDPNG